MILLQETWVADDSEQLIIHDYVVFHEAALPAIGRNVMGLSSFFRLTSFSGGTLQKLASPLPWVLAVRWAVGDNGVIFVNVYAAIHTVGCLRTDVTEFGNYISDFRDSFGGDELVIAGDWNVNRFRRPRPDFILEREMLGIMNDLVSDGFTAYPSPCVVTFSDAFTTLDYALIPSGIRVVS